MCYYDSMEHRDEGQRTLPNRPQTLLSHKAFSTMETSVLSAFFVQIYNLLHLNNFKVLLLLDVPAARGRPGFYPGVIKKFFRISLRKGRKEDGEMEKFAHQFVKTKGFEKTVAFQMSLSSLLWEAMQEKKNFRMVLEYDAEAQNVNIDFEDATSS